ncbi:MAG TPA: hypothetical protein V6C57_04225 [Coleofasciculaceae cyanobacterium]
MHSPFHTLQDLHLPIQRDRSIPLKAPDGSRLRELSNAIAPGQI